MNKPRNDSAAKQSRRLKALEQVQRRIDNKGKPERNEKLTAAQKQARVEQAKKELATLEART